ncbi:MAG: SMP-30/gluconolactonase/LRE family protein [Ignavibacteriae bacterium]|nr:SMP-30/gluconolactonase/LRE family protein [Ignavibacteriota bacterium]
MLSLFPIFAFAQTVVQPGGAVEKIVGDLEFLEGPVWKDGVGLLFSDIPANTVYGWTPDSGTRVFLKPSFNSNGLTLDNQGRLILTQTGERQIARLEMDGKLTPLASSFEGKKFNSPNDIVVKSDGSILFTDPPFNIPKGEQKELSFSGIYRISPSGELSVLDSTLKWPNGICFSPDESKLYVNESPDRIIYVWDVVNGSTLANKRVFGTIEPKGYADGMKIDREGNLFCTGPGGVWVFSSAGKLMEMIPIPGQPTNCNWGDADRKTLYVTTSKAVYRVRFTTGGIIE